MSRIENTALLLIDIQKGLDEHEFYGGNRNNLSAEENASRLLHHWRKSGGLVIHVKHNSTNPESPLYPGKPGNQFKEIVLPTPTEAVIEKNVNAAFIGTSLEEILRSNEINSVILVGLVTDHCISSTARMAANLGFDTTIVADATATFDRMGMNEQIIPAEQVHECALASLQGEFARVMDIDKVKKEHP